jgi:hypothetical protein
MDNKEREKGQTPFTHPVKVGVKEHNGQLCITYKRQPPSFLKLSSGLPSAQPYNYVSLPPRSIRLLQIIPQTDPDALSFNFLTCSLDEVISGHVSYSAISYCWGDMPKDERLGIEETSWVPVTTKVADMLPKLVSRHALNHNTRYGDYGKQSPMIWLDAVCINQKDNVERAEQVRHMAEIYSHAKCVEIFLDSSWSSVGTIMKSSLSRASNDVPYKLERGMSRNDDSWLFEPYSNEDITALMCSPWFSRAWVVQEFCFAKEHCFHYGDMTITFLFLKMVQEWGGDLAFCRLIDERRLRCEIPLMPLIQNMPNLCSLRDQIHMKKDHLHSLEDILGRFYALKTTDPRDKIFAMLGLATGDCLNSITIDYDISVPDLFLGVMTAISKDITNYILLNFAGLAAYRPSFATRHEIPSWVPDFSEPPSHTTWSICERGFNATDLPDYGGIHAPVLTLKHAIPSQPQLNALGLQGFCFDKIVGVLRGNENRDLSQLAKFVRKAAAAVDSLRPYPNGTSPKEVLRHTLIATNPESMKQDPEGDGFESFYKHVQSRTETFDVESVWKLKGRYLQTMMREGTACSRGVFWTRKGYFGLAANECKAGDEVWLAMGAKIPFIFRGPVFTRSTDDGRELGFYNLVCEAYVHGIMEGEQWDNSRASRVFLI